MFLDETKQVPQKERKETLAKLSKDKLWGQSIEDYVIELLDHVESVYSPIVAGHLFRKLLFKQINVDTFLRATYVLKSVYIRDLVSIADAIKRGSAWHSFDSDSLTILGVTNFDMDNHEHQTDPDHLNIELTPVGELLVECTPV